MGCAVVVIEIVGLPAEIGLSVGEVYDVLGPLVAVEKREVVGQEVVRSGRWSEIRWSDGDGLAVGEGPGDAVVFVSS